MQNSSMKAARWAGFLCGAVFALFFSALALDAHAGGNAPWGGGGAPGAAEGAPLAGGTASRLLFSDASGNVSTATPALGAALTLSGAASVGTTLGVTGATTLSSTLRTDGNLDLRGTITSGGSLNCGNAGTGVVCFGESIAVQGSGSGDTAVVAVRNGNPAGFSGLVHYTAGAAVAIDGRVGNWGSTHATTAWRSKAGITGTGGLFAATTASRTAGQTVFEFMNNTSTTVASVDGVGAIRIAANTAAHGTTCNSGSEGTFYYRTIAASNKSGMCMCAQTSSGVYAWKAALTFGSSALTDGDC